MTNRLRLFTFLMVSALSLYGLAAPTRPALPVWLPDKALLNRLDKTATAEGFQIRLPKGYTLQRRQGPDKSEAFGWVSSPRKDGTRAYVMLMVMAPPPAEIGKHTEQILDSFLKSIQSRRAKDWQRTPAERGAINGIPFVRARWSGTTLEPRFKMHGVNYVAIIGSKMIQLSSQDVEPYYPEALKLAETSICTFKKIDKPK